MTHFSDGLAIGGAFTNPIVGSQGGFGIQTSQSCLLDIVPLTKNASAYAALQTPAASAIALAAGTGVSAVVVNNVTRFTADAERCVTITSGGNDTGITFLVSGYNSYGQPQTQTITGGSGATVTTKKAFQSIVSVVPSGSVASTVTVGTADTFGLPIRTIDKGYVSTLAWNGGLNDSGTFVVADQTSPATSLTGDTCGTYAPSSSSNGTSRLVVELIVSVAQSAAGPSTAATTAILGVTSA